MAWREIEIDLMKILNDYEDKVEKIAEKDLKKVANETAKDLRATSPSKSGDYAKGWAVKTETGFGGSKSYRVYNRKKPGLTHLLENGHVVRPTPTHPDRKTRVNGIKHIKLAEERAKVKLIKLIEGDL